MAGCLLNDPPAHTRLRDPVRRSFSPTVVRKLAPRIEFHVNTLLDNAGDECEFLEDFARPLTALVICDLLGVDTDQQGFLTDWSREFGKLIYGTSSRDANYITAVARMGDLFHDRFSAQIEARRRAPADDLLSLLVSASEEEQWTESELIGACSMLLFAGHDTTSALLASGARALLQNQDQLSVLRNDPKLMPTAVEELLRFDGPSKTNIRVASQNMMLGGHEILEGQHLWLGVMAANHDPCVFQQPDQLDLRRNPNPHIAFGAGIHFCLGPSLARVEAQVAFTCLLERYPNIDLRPHVYDWSPTIVRPLPDITAFEPEITGKFFSQPTDAV